MKKIVLLVLLILGGYNHAYTQERWISNIELDLVFPNKKDYFYNDSDNKINDVELSNQGFLLKSFGIHGDYNYLLLKKLSIGALGGSLFFCLTDKDVGLFTQGAMKYWSPQFTFAILIRSGNVHLILLGRKIQIV